MKILRNAARCLICDEVIESKFRHDFVTCKGGHFFVDGGRDYCRYGGLTADVDVEQLVDASLYEDGDDK